MFGTVHRPTVATTLVAVLVLFVIYHLLLGRRKARP